MEDLKGEENRQEIKSVTCQYILGMALTSFCSVATYEMLLNGCTTSQKFIASSLCAAFQLGITLIPCELD